MTVGCQTLFRATTGAARTTFHIPGTVASDGCSQAISHHCPHPAEEKQAQGGEDTCPEPHRKSVRLKLTPQASRPTAWPFAFLSALSFERAPNPTCAHVVLLLLPFFPPLKGGRISSYLPSSLSSSFCPQGSAQLVKTSIGQSTQTWPKSYSYHPLSRILQNPLSFLNHIINGYYLLKHLV